MGFKEFLKGMFEGFFKIDARKIIFKDSTIIHGDQIINDKEQINRVFEEIEKYKTKDTLPFQVIHEELADDLFTYEEISIKEKASIQRLKRVLPLEEVECILMARRVVLADQKGDKELFKELLHQLEKNYPSNGKKVFNLIGTGYFDELILPMISIFNSPEKFKQFYEELLKFFPIAVFVGNNTPEERIKKEIDKRLQLKDIPIIRIHTMGDENIKKVENAVKALDLKEDYQTNINTFISPSGLEAQIYEIKFKN